MEPSVRLLLDALGWACRAGADAEQGSPKDHSARDVQDVLRALAVLGHVEGAITVDPTLPPVAAYRKLRESWSAIAAFAALDARIPNERREARERAVDALTSLGRKALGDLERYMGETRYEPPTVPREKRDRGTGGT